MVEPVRAFARSIEPIIYWLFGVSLTLLLIKLFLLDAIPAPSPALYKLGYLAETTLRSLLAGTIFYVSVTATKIYTDRKRLAPWLVERLTVIISRHEELSEYLIGSTPLPGSDNERVAAAFERLGSSDLSPEIADLNGRQVTWREYLKTYAKDIADFCAQIGRRGSYMDTAILRTVSEVEHSDFVVMIITLPEFFNVPFKLEPFHAPFANTAR